MRSPALSLKHISQFDSISRCTVYTLEQTVIKKHTEKEQDAQNSGRRTNITRVMTSKNAVIGNQIGSDNLSYWCSQILHSEVY